MFAADRDVAPRAVLDGQLDPEAVGGAIAADRERAGRRDGATSRGGWPSRACCGRTSPSTDAAHILWVITSFDAFDLLYTGRGLPLEEVARLLVATAERALLR